MIARSELDALHDELYVLACAVDDVERDLAATATPTARELADALGLAARGVAAAAEPGDRRRLTITSPAGLPPGRP